jgi:hypothetical protein
MLLILILFSCSCFFSANIPGFCTPAWIHSLFLYSVFAVSREGHEKQNHREAAATAAYAAPQARPLRDGLGELGERLESIGSCPAVKTA